MASPNREELYRMALNAAKNGQRKPAKVMLQQLLSQDDKHIRAMMLMARISGKKERRKWLNRVLDVDPDYDDALDQLEKLEYSDVAKRNQQLLKYGLGAGAVVVIALALLMIISAAATPI
jgi:cytochrome c-type biogenesis protein CcmH/NrfG